MEGEAGLTVPLNVEPSNRHIYTGAMVLKLAPMFLGSWTRFRRARPSAAPGVGRGPRRAVVKIPAADAASEKFPAWGGGWLLLARQGLAAR